MRYIRPFGSVSCRAWATILAMNDSTSNSGPSVYRYPEERRAHRGPIASRASPTASSGATHAREPQPECSRGAPGGARASGRERSPVVVARVPLRVGADEMAHDAEYRDRVRGGRGRRGDDDRVAHHGGVCDRPFDRLLPAHAAADDRVQAVDPQALHEAALSTHHVPHRDDREADAVAAPGLRIRAGRSRGLA